MATGRGKGNTAVGVESTAVVQVTEEPDRPQLAARRMPSFSDAFSKITTNPFNRRRTTTLLQSSTSSAFLSHTSRIPTPSGISRSTSFLGTLSGFASRTSSINGGSEDLEPSATIKPSRKISDRLAQTPFFQHQRINTTPFFNKQRRESAVQIEQRGLMAPLHPPLPRSSTMGNLGRGQSAQHSPITPSFMRSTSSSAAHRTGLNTPKRHNTPMPSIPSSKTPTSASRMPLTGLGGSRKPASGRHPTPSTGLASSSVPPTGESCQPSIGDKPSTRLLTTKGHPRTHHGRNLTTGTHAHTPPNSRLSGRNSGLPSPKERRMGWSQGSKTERRLASSLRYSDHGSDGTSELTVLKMDDPAVAGISPRGVAKASDQNIAQINTTVPASNDGDIQTNGPTHPVDNEAQDTREKADLTAIDDQETAGWPEPTDPPFPPRDTSNPCLIHAALHPLEWTGRFTALSDRFRTSALPSSPARPLNLKTKPSASSVTLTDSFHEPMHDEVQRNRRIWIHMHSLCTTDEARESLAAYRVLMDEREKKRAGGVKGAKVKEKQGFFQALMGKKK